MQRVIELSGCLNFRDLGGYPTRDGRMVRWRQLFRSDALYRLTEEAIVHLRQVIRLGDVIDLRSSAERSADGCGPLVVEAIRSHHLPLFDGETARQADSRPVETLADRYFLLADFAKRPIARVIETIASTTEPLVYHCAAGKDRTGVISAIVLSLLDVKEEVIVADYAATRENLDAIVDRLMSLEGYRSMLEALPPDTMHAEPETMIEFLDRMRAEYGSMQEYALSAGISEHAVRRLQERLLVAMPEGEA
jgi:protein tyrosine/serine phosphatase